MKKALIASLTAATLVVASTSQVSAAGTQTGAYGGGVKVATPSAQPEKVHVPEKTGLGDLGVTGIASLGLVAAGAFLYLSKASSKSIRIN